MAKYRVRVEGVRLVEADSPKEAATIAAADARMMDVVATVIGEQEKQIVQPTSTRHGLGKVH